MRNQLAVYQQPKQRVSVLVPPALQIRIHHALPEQWGGPAARPWLVMMYSAMMAWSSKSVSVPSSATTISVHPQTLSAQRIESAVFEAFG
jgi:hypothetical protein